MAVRDLSGWWRCIGWGLVVVFFCWLGWRYVTWSNEVDQREYDQAVMLSKEPSWYMVVSDANEAGSNVTVRVSYFKKPPTPNEKAAYESYTLWDDGEWEVGNRWIQTLEHIWEKGKSVSIIPETPSDPDHKRWNAFKQRVTSSGKCLRVKTALRAMPHDWTYAVGPAQWLDLEILDEE